VKRRLLRLLGIVAFVAPALALLLAATPVGQVLERRMYDTWFRMRGPLEKPSELVLVTIDVDSEESLGRYPWPRELHASLIRNLHRAGARVVAFDATFGDAFPRSDTVLRRAIDETGIVVLGAKNDGLISTRAARTSLEEPAGVLQGVPIGMVDIARDAVDGVIREYPMGQTFPGGRVVPQLGVQVLLRYLGLPPEAFRPAEDGWWLGERFIPRGPLGGMLINYVGPPGYLTQHSYATVVDDASTDIGDWDFDYFEDLLAEGWFEDRIVLVGSTVPEHQDLHPTPLRDTGGAGAQLRPGVEIHAHALATILSGQHVRRIPLPVQWAWTALLAVVLVVAVPRLRFRGGAALGMALAAGAAVAGWYFFTRESLWLWSVAPALSTGLSYAGSAAVLYFTEEQEKARIRGMFQQYVAASVVDELIRKPELLALGGEERVATVLFSDVAGFSSVSEHLTPTELVALLNEYLTAMTDVLVEHGGTIDKYQGDAIMAEFGVPVPFEDHAERACRAALGMKAALRALRAKWAGEGKPELAARIGINTGTMLVGNLGSSRIMDYTVMGDHVNLASRLEGTNRVYGTEVMLSEFTWREVESAFIGRELDWIRVKGKGEAVGVWEVVATREVGVGPETAELHTGFADALALYRARRFEAAAAAFAALAARFPEDGPSRVYVERCREYVEAPPPEGWDGVYVMTTK
jgi:adenylate cyclase